jgi:hypothetical protein
MNVEFRCCVCVNLNHHCLTSTMGKMLLESVKSVSSTRENAVLQWAIKFNSALATA